MSEQGYYRFATIHNDTIVFTCEDDLWSVPISGGTARRLTAAHGECILPRLSPDGRYIAYVGRDEGHPEIFVIPAEGGLPRRLTYFGGELCYTAGWSQDSKEVLFISDSLSPFLRHTEAFAIDIDGGVPRPLNLGHLLSLGISDKGAVAIGRNSIDPARWKRYLGGTAGEIWIDERGKHDFKRFTEIRANLVSPMFIGNRVYFLSDHEGVGNIYSARPDGSDLTRHTDHRDYYVRFPTTDGRHIVYTCGADIFVLDAKTDATSKVKVSVPTTTNQSLRRFVDARRNLEHFAPHPEGHSLAIIARGQPVTMPNWEGAVIQHGKGSRCRYRNAEWLADGKRFVVVSDASGAERVELHHADQSEDPIVVSTGDIGRVVDLKVSPRDNFVALSNHRQELLLLDLKTKRFKVIDKSPADRISGIAWSHDGRWIAYNWAAHPQSFIIRVADKNSLSVHDVTKELRFDYQPCFDPQGRYLYFLSSRDFYPVYDSVQFDLSFPSSVRPFLVTLRKDVESPFAPKLKSAGQAKDDEREKKRGKQASEEAKGAGKNKGAAASRKQAPPVEIDFDGIEHRMLGFPVLEGRYGEIAATKNRVFFTQFPVRGIRPHHYNWMAEFEEAASIMVYDLDEQRAATYQRNAWQIRLSQDKQTLFARVRDRIRATSTTAGLAAENAEPAAVAETPGKKTGWIDIGRAHILVHPRDEWQQMYEEAWRLQSEHFWDPSMSQVDWNLVHDRYSILLKRIRTRSELSDVIWEMQGELGTSHAYEMGGDYRRSPSYYRGFLGANLSWDKRAAGYRIDKIIRGDSWDSEFDSPLAQPGLDIREGDVIVKVGGRQATKECSVDELLINLAGKQVGLTISRAGKKRNVVVKTLRTERLLRYRNWVETNRKIVHQKSKGRLGYLHIPDMGPAGFSEFHRSYLHEFHKDGMIVDVRYNRGGHVSPLLLEKLARKRVGYDISRWGPPQPYPGESIAGPMVAITNQFAGSDGDIFSHCFKLYKLGQLVGKRTWGGVIGIWPRHALVDGTVTTQPEFSFWFVDVGWRVENYGTDPDHDIDITPQDYMHGRDPQMEKALELALAALKKRPVVLPDFSQRPCLRLPHAKLSAGARKSQGQADSEMKVAASKTTRPRKDRTGGAKASNSGARSGDRAGKGKKTASQNPSSGRRTSKGRNTSDSKQRRG